MEDTLKLLITKLDNIDKRLQTIEGGTESVSSAQQSLDPLFKKAIDLIESDNKDEFSITYMKKQLNVDEKRASKIMDQLAAAGYGTCYMGEVN